MKRLFFRGDQKTRVAEILFGDRDAYCSADFIRYAELEVVWHRDGRYSAWGNLADDTVLLQDTVRDPKNKIKQIFSFANEIREET